jgi:predicted transcriptional regulator
MLETARRGTRKTPIMYKMSLSYAQLTKYLKALEKAGLIREESKVWQTTESGIKVIEACRICQDLMNQIGLSETNSPDRTRRTR